jgi:hypothetical protein
MELFNVFKRKDKSLEDINAIKDQLKSIEANYQQQFSHYSPIYYAPWTGEKTPGEMGAAKNYNLQYNYLRIRSWQAFTESEFAQVIIKKFSKWVVGSGLKVQPEPCEIVLNQENIKFDTTDLIKQIEARFNIYSGSRFSDYANMEPLDRMAFEAHKNAKVGGDVLTILRIIGNMVKVQIVDGSHVMNPYLRPEWYQAAKERSNVIRHGVEIAENGEHVAYYVQDQLGKSTRIPRIGPNSGNLMAFLTYGSRHRIDNTRGMPLLSAVLETIKKLDRYKEATVGSAEEVAKVAYWIKHGTNSTGESPLLAKMVQAQKMGMGSAPESQSTDTYEAAATKIATTTNKQVFNMPIDSSLEALRSENPLFFKDFYTTNGEFLCAAVEIPYEVALALYRSNYSASRAAIKDWEHTFKTDRVNFSGQFYQPIYNLWFELNVLLGKFQAPGYIQALNLDNVMAIEAYQSARWLGVNAPQIDPLKEVAAERMKLGDETTPLTTYDQATEALASGDFSTIMTKVKIEQKLTDGLKQEVPPVIPGEQKKDKKKKLNALLSILEEHLIKYDNE